MQCTNCGAMLTREDVANEWVRCDYCGAEFEMAQVAEIGQEPAVLVPSPEPPLAVQPWSCQVLPRPAAPALFWPS